MLTSDSVDPEIEERWQARFRAARMTLPQWARLQPERCLFVSNASGTFELYRWDRSTDSTAQVTDRPAGTHIGAIDPSGEWIWWFDDADGNEFGIWRRQPFSPTEAAASGPDPAEIAAPGLAASYPSGLCLGESGLAIIGQSTDDGASVYVVRPGHEPALLYAHQQDASVVALSRDGLLVALEHSEHGDSRHTALRVLQIDGGATVGDLWDGPGLGLEAVAFAPVAGDTRLIARHERLGRWVPFIWDVASGEQHALGLELDLPGDVSATWYTDASGLLVAHEYQARSSLYRYDLAAGTLEQLEIPAGTVSGQPPAPTASSSSCGRRAPSPRPSVTHPAASWCSLRENSHLRRCRSRTSGLTAPADQSMP